MLRCITIIESPSYKSRKRNEKYDNDGTRVKTMGKSFHWEHDRDRGADPDDPGNIF